MKIISTKPGWKLMRDHGNDAFIAGIDEVGRGAWAGPVVAGAVILPFGARISGLNDSKLVSPAKRLVLDVEIRRRALAFGIGWVSCAEIDEHGLSWAVRQSGLRALAALGHHFDVIILDGKHNYLADDMRSRVIIKADSRVTPVAAGSIIAKVARDQYMERLHLEVPHYGFDLHKGYGTASHRQALAEAGPCDHHRRSYAPIKELIV